MKPTATTTTFCVGETSVVKINVGPLNNLWAYELKVKYDETLVNAKGEFDNSWFDLDGDGSAVWTGGDPCSDGVCPFAKTELAPDPAVSGSGAVATVTFTGQAAGEFDVTITESLLSTKDGAPISHSASSKLHLKVCGFASAPRSCFLAGSRPAQGHGRR